MTLGSDQLIQARHLLKLSQNDLAGHARVAVSTIDEFERGQRSFTPDEEAAILQVFDRTSIRFEDGGVLVDIGLTFVTERGNRFLGVTYAPNSCQSVVKLLSLFWIGGDWPKGKMNIFQCATPEFKQKVADFVACSSNTAPQLFRLQKMLNDMRNGEYFLVLPFALDSTKAELDFRMFLHQLTHPQDQRDDELNKIFGGLLELYNIFEPETEKHNLIGNPRKADRICRFCGGTIATQSTFKKRAHAMPAALGNKYLKLADECDTCNGYFGDTIEPTLVEYLNIQRVSLGIEAREGRPKVEFDGGWMFSVDRGDDKNLMVVVSKKISKDASGVLTVQLGNGKLIVPQDIYRTLAKIALSVINSAELPALSKTVRWVRYGEGGDKPLPSVASAIVPLSSDLSARITVYIRKEPHPRLPHVVCEFRLGCYMYVYTLPFSKNDESDLIGFFDEEDFKATFRHYGTGISWAQNDYSLNEEITLSQNIKVEPRNP